MAITIRHKRGTTTPSAASLATGELAINTATGSIFTKTDAGSVVTVGGLSTADIGGGSTTAGNLILAALQNANAPSSTNPIATEGDVNSAVASFSAQVAACKAWVNFNGTGTVAIRAAHNVSSITDNSTGNYTVNFTAALADGNYAVSGFAAESVFSVAISVGNFGTLTQTASAFRFNTTYNGTAYDCTQVHLAVFR